MKFVLYFRTKHKDAPTPFRKARIPRYDTSERQAFVAIIEEENLKRAWDCVFVSCPDYSSLGEHRLSDMDKVCNPERPNEMIEPTLEQIAARTR